MMCEECGIRPAKFHLMTITNDERAERNLCPVCMAKYQKQLPGIDFSNLAGILNNILENHAGREKDAADEELSALLESPDAPALLRDAAREVLDSRAEWKAAEQRRRAKETEREQESTPRGGFFSGLFGGRDDDKPRKNQPPEF